MTFDHIMDVSYTEIDLFIYLFWGGVLDHKFHILQLEF